MLKQMVVDKGKNKAEKTSHNLDSDIIIDNEKEKKVQKPGKKNLNKIMKNNDCIISLTSSHSLYQTNICINFTKKNLTNIGTMTK